jgi:spore germination cell wall hydrolase CwlJ-like protein
MVGAALGWSVRVLARWALGAGLLVSFTADAGVDALTGYSAQSPFRTVDARPLSIDRPEAPRVLFSGEPIASLDIVRPTSISALAPAENALRYETKNGLPTAHFVDRRNRGDALPGLSARRADRARSETHLVIFGTEPMAGVPAGSAGSTDTLAARRFATPASLPSTTTVESRIPVRADDRSRAPDGSTPSAPRGIARETATPWPAEPELRRMLAATTPEGDDRARLHTGLFPLATEAERSTFARLVDPGRPDAERYCLAQAIYFEARSEPLAGQAAVAQVIFNRILSGLYPTTICGVVFQNSERYLRCEFTFTCEGKSLDVTDAASWAVAVRLAREVTEGRIYNTAVGDATHYHADYVNPRWAAYLEKLEVIGRHIFYRVKPDMPGGVCPGCLLSQRGETRTPRG